MFSERRYLNKELAEHAKAQDAALENDAEQYFRHQAKAERQAERADRAHNRHLAKEGKILKKEALEHRMAQESLSRGDTAGFAHHEYRAARYHNRAGRKNAHSHYPAPAGHSHHHNPLYRGDIPTPGLAHEEVPIGAYGGVPPLGVAPIGGTMPVASTTSLVPPVPVPPAPMMGRMGGYTEEIFESPSPYYTAPPSGRRSMPPQTVRDFDVLDWERDFIPTNRPLGVAPEFRRVLPNAGYW